MTKEVKYITSNLFGLLKLFSALYNDFPIKNSTDIQNYKYWQ